MAAKPRVIFTRFAHVENPVLAPWLAHVSRVLGPRAPAVVSVADPTVWQLVSANNRELARSTQIFAGFRAASDSAAATIKRVGSAVVRPVVDEGAGLQGWYLMIDGEPAVICSRWYLADRERSQAVNLALTSLGVAELSTGARVALERSPREKELRMY